MKKLFTKAVTVLFALLIVFSTATTSFAAAKVGKVTSLQAYNIDDDEINLKWKKVSNAVGYQVYVYSSDKWKLIATTKNTNYEAENLSSSKQYKFRVRAYSISGNKKNYGEYSSILTAVTRPDEVENLTVSAKTKTTVTLKWSKVPRATGYQVYIYSSTTGKYTKKASVKSNKLTVTGLKANKNYKFKVRAYTKINSKAYFGEFSDAVSVKTLSVSNNSNSTAKANSNLISKAEATAIALKHAGLNANNAYNIRCELDKEKGLYVYEVEFEKGKYEYEYTINAKSGKIIRAEKEID